MNSVTDVILACSAIAGVAFLILIYLELKKWNRQREIEFIEIRLKLDVVTANMSMLSINAGLIASKLIDISSAIGLDPFSQFTITVTEKKNG